MERFKKFLLCHFATALSAPQRKAPRWRRIAADWGLRSSAAAFRRDCHPRVSVILTGISHSILLFFNMSTELTEAAGSAVELSRSGDPSRSRERPRPGIGRIRSRGIAAEDEGAQAFDSLAVSGACGRRIRPPARPAPSNGPHAIERSARDFRFVRRRQKPPPMRRRGALAPAGGSPTETLQIDPGMAPALRRLAAHARDPAATMMHSMVCLFQTAIPWSNYSRQPRRRGATAPPARFVPARAVFGIASITMVRSSQSSSGPAGRASDGVGLGRGAAGPDRRCTTTAATGHSESSFRTDPSVCPIMLRHRYRWSTI